MKVGDLMKLKTDCLGNKKGTIGVVFYDYSSGVQVIFPNGNYDGFGNDDIDNWLKKTGHSERHENYSFQSVIQVSHDFSNGLWNGILS